MSDTGGFPLVGGNAQFPGKNNVTRDGSGGNSFGWENLNVSNLSVVAGYRNKATGLYSGAVGYVNSNTGSYSFIFGAVNTISGSPQSSFIAGESNTVSNGYSASFGQANTISGGRSFAAGFSNTVSASYSVALGHSSTASGTISFACGQYTLASRYCDMAHGGAGVLVAGSCQHGWLIFGNQSTSATPINLYLDGATATQNAVLGTGARWKCTAEIIATTTGAINKSASWEYKFQIDRPTNAASTIIRTTPLLSLSDGSNAGAPPAGWAVAITADTTNGCPQIQVTGDTDTINWTCAIHYIQSIRV
jgi:hypothetical protein